MKTSLVAALMIATSLALPACAADATGSSSEATAQAPVVVSTYAYQGSKLELTGQPLATGLFDITLRLETPEGAHSVELTSTASDDLLPELSDALGAMSPGLLAVVREKIAATPVPAGETDARWLTTQMSIFSAQPTGGEHPAISCEDIGGRWWDCGGTLHCCVFSHDSICGFLCKL